MLFLEIGMMVIGIVIVATGKMVFSRTKVATGPPAYFAGIALILPLPVNITIGVVYALAIVRGGGQFEGNHEVIANVIEITVMAIFFALSMIIAAVYGKPPPRRLRSRYDDDEDDEDDDEIRATDLPRRRRRRTYDDEDDVPPRRRRKVDDGVDDEDAGSARKSRDPDRDRFRE